MGTDVEGRLSRSGQAFKPHEDREPFSVRRNPSADDSFGPPMHIHADHCTHSLSTAIPDIILRDRLRDAGLAGKERWRERGQGRGSRRETGGIKMRGRLSDHQTMAGRRCLGWVEVNKVETRSSESSESSDGRKMNQRHDVGSHGCPKLKGYINPSPVQGAPSRMEAVMQPHSCIFSER